MSKNVIELFKINKPHGIKGELKVTALWKIECDLNYFHNKYCFIKINNLLKPFEIEYITNFKENYLIKFKNINNINEVMHYHNLNILFNDQDQIFSYQLDSDNNFEGYDVYFGNNIIGIVKNKLVTKAHIVFEIYRSDNNSKMLIPNVKEYIKEINYEKKYIVLEKLIDL